MTPDVDHWLHDCALRVSHHRASDASAEHLWQAARQIRVCDTALLGRLIRWRIPGTLGSQSFDELFSAPPFIVLERGPTALVSGIVGRIWTLRRDYPQLETPEEFRSWRQRGTAKVVFANWATDSALYAEVRVQTFGAQGRVGLAAVRPLIGAFQHLIASDGIATAVRIAEAS